MLGEGAFFGEMALLSGAPRSATVESAAPETQVFEISATTLAQISRAHPQVFQALKKFCRERMLANLMATSAIFRPFSSDEPHHIPGIFRSRAGTKDARPIIEGERAAAARDLSGRWRSRRAAMFSTV